MATFSGLPPVREDFRCSLCRQKGVFHCEHDTPYRDQLLGTYDQEKPHMIQTNSRRESRRTSSQKSNNRSANHHKTKNVHTGTKNAHIGTNQNTGAGAQYQQDQRSDNNSRLNTYTNGSMRTDEQKKKNKSCVIL